MIKTKKRSIILAISLIVVAIALTATISIGYGSNNSEIKSAKSTVHESEAAECIDWATSAEDTTELISESSLAGTVKVISSKTELREDMVFTKSIVEMKYPDMISKDIISEVIGNDEVSSKNSFMRIEVLQTGGSCDGVTTEAFPDAPLLDVGGKYMLFLEATDEGHYLITGGFRGIAEIKDSKVSFLTSENKVAFSELENIPTNDVAKTISKMEKSNDQILINTSHEKAYNFIAE